MGKVEAIQCKLLPVPLEILSSIWKEIWGWSHGVWASLVAQLVKNLPATWEIWVRSLGWEEPLEKGKATHSSLLTWRIPWGSGSMV